MHRLTAFFRHSSERDRAGRDAIEWSFIRHVNYYGSNTLVLIIESDSISEWLAAWRGSLEHKVVEKIEYER